MGTRIDVPKATELLADLERLSAYFENTDLRLIYASLICAATELIALSDLEDGRSVKENRNFRNARIEVTAALAQMKIAAEMRR